jgi:hypothetical protein
MPYLNPNDMQVNWRRGEDGARNASSTRARSWFSFRCVVSNRVSADPRAGSRRRRSAAMPSASMPSPWSGWARRTFSKRRMITSSSASTNTRWGLKPPLRRSSMTPTRSVMNARERTSRTIAVRRTSSPPAAASSAAWPTSDSGRLSMT